jgi:DNA-binding transcriptional MerR regulator
MPIEMFAQASLELAKQALEALPPRRKLGQIRVFQDQRDRWLKVLEQIAPDGTQQEKTAKLLEWIEERLKGADLTEEAHPEESAEPEPQTVVEPPSTSSNDPLRQDIQQLVGAIQQLVTLQQATVAQSAIPPNRVQRAKPSPPSQTEKAIRAAPNSDDAPLPDPPKRNKSSIHDSQHLIDTWIQAIMDYNDASDRRHDDKWAITISLLKSVGGSQPRIEKTLRERQEIHLHHQKHHIDPNKHNLKHRGKRKVTDVIEV